MNTTATLVISAFVLIFVSSIAVVMFAAFRSGLRGFLVATGSATAIFTVFAIVGWSMLGQLDPYDDTGPTQGFAFSLIAFAFWLAISTLLSALTIGIRNTKKRASARRKIS